MYSKIAPSGYYAKSDAAVMFQASEVFLATVDKDTIETEVDLMLENAFGDSKKRIIDFTPLHFTAMAAPHAKSKLSIEQRKGLVVLLNRWLIYQNRCKHKVEVIGYRVDPSLTVGEVAVETFNNKLNTIGMPLPSPMISLTSTDIREQFSFYMTGLRQLFKTVDAIVLRIGLYCDNLLYRIHHGAVAPSTLSQFEKTLLVHMDKNSKYAMFRGKIRPLRSSEISSDPTIASVIADVQSHVQEGPKTKFIGLLSNGRPEDLVYYVGPYAPTLMSATGFITHLGAFDMINLKISDSIPWTQDDQVRGIQEVMGTISGSVAQVPIYEYSPSSRKPEPTQRDVLKNPPLAVREFRCWNDSDRVLIMMDLPEIQFEWDALANEGHGGLKYYYFNRWHGRNLPVGSPEAVLIDRAISSFKPGVDSAKNMSEVGAPLTGLLQLDTFKWADLSELKAAGKIVEIYDDTNRAAAQQVVMTRRVKDGKFDQEPVPIDSYLRASMTHAILPAFSEYWIPPVEELLRENTAIEDYLARAMELSTIDRKRSAIPIRMSYNEWRLKTLLGVRELPRDVTQLSKLWCQRS